MQISTKFDVGADVIEKSTNRRGDVSIVGVDEVGICYQVRFIERQHGRRLHWKRETEIKLAPKAKPTDT